MDMKHIRQYLTFDKCKPEIEAYKVFDGIEIPVAGYADLKGKMVIEDKCKFQNKEDLKKIILDHG